MLLAGLKPIFQNFQLLPNCEFILWLEVTFKSCKNLFKIEVAYFFYFVIFVSNIAKAPPFY